MAGVDDADRERYLGVIERRVRSGLHRVAVDPRLAQRACATRAPPGSG